MPCSRVVSGGPQVFDVAPQFIDRDQLDAAIEQHHQCNDALFPGFILVVVAFAAPGGAPAEIVITVAGIVHGDLMKEGGGTHRLRADDTGIRTAQDPIAHAGRIVLSGALPCPCHGPIAELRISRGAQVCGGAK